MSQELIYKQVMIKFRSESTSTGERLFSEEEIKKFFKECYFAEKSQVEDAMRPLEFG